ncbi:MAG: hypothetical protein RL226_1579, partial [Bacteroidota bacterium]
MPILEMKVPSPGESISEVEIASWLVSDGDWVEKDQTIAEVDSDKATLELPAEQSGIITLKAAAGDVVAVGDVVCLIDTDAKRPEGAAAPAAATPAKQEAKVTPVAETTKKEEKQPAPAKVDSYAAGHPSPAAKKMLDENGIAASRVNGTGRDGRITQSDVLKALSAGFTAEESGWTGNREERREKMSTLRRKIAERLVSVKNETAMLTTFNEVNMQPVMDMRNKYKDVFKE